MAKKGFFMGMLMFHVVKLASRKSRMLFLGGLVAGLLVFGLTVMGCATTNKGGTPGLINQFSAGQVLVEGQTEVANYTTILGLVSFGLPEYESAVKNESVNVVITTYLGLFTKTVAYRQ
jgi:hypothetical protein